MPLPQWGQNIVRGLFSLIDHAITDHTGIPGAGGATNFSQLAGTVSVAQGATPWTEASINLTDAEIKALFSAPKQLIAAPGAGLVISLLRFELHLDNAAGAYATGTGSIDWKYGAAGAVIGSIASSSFFTGDIGIKLVYSQATNAGTTATLQVNQPLFIARASADFTGGNAANKATVKVMYRIVSAAPN